MSPARRFVPVVLGLAVALAAIELVACFINPTPPVPIDVPEGLHSDPGDASDASEEPG